MSTLSELPELPEGYFWRVGPKEGRHNDGWRGEYIAFGVSLRRRRVFGSECVEYSLRAENPDTIIREARSLKIRLDQRLKMRADYEKVLELAGDYPPKKWWSA